MSGKIRSVLKRNLLARPLTVCGHEEASSRPKWKSCVTFVVVYSPRCVLRQAVLIRYGMEGKQGICQNLVDNFDTSVRLVLRIPQLRVTRPRNSIDNPIQGSKLNR